MLPPAAMRPIGEHAAIQTPSVHTAIQAPNMHAAAAQAHAAAPRWAARNSNVSSMYAAAAQAHAAPAHADALAIETELAGPLVGHRLTHAEFLEGWLSLFDGQTNYGWQGAESKYGSLLGGRVTGRSGPCELHALVCARRLPRARESTAPPHARNEPARERGHGYVCPHRATAPLGPGHQAPRPGSPVQRQRPGRLAAYRLHWAARGRRTHWKVVDRTIRALGRPGALAKASPFNMVLVVPSVPSLCKLPLMTVSGGGCKLGAQGPCLVTSCSGS